MSTTSLPISIVYVSWRSHEVLLRSLERLHASTRKDEHRPEVAVVLNEASDVAAEAVASAWPGATIVVNRDNKGFGPACNQGARIARGDILLFLNPDTLASDGAVADLCRAFIDCPSAVAVAPRLTDAVVGRSEDQRQFQLRRLPTLMTDARELLLIDRIMPRNASRRQSRYLDEDRDRPIVVEQAAAAALAVRRSAFEAVGGFDERFYPAYWEDVDLCARLGSLGEILYWPQSCFGHVGGVSAGELGRGRFYRVYYANALRYRLKHYSPAAALAYRVLVVLGMSLRVFASLAPAHGRLDRPDTVRGLMAVASMALSGRPDEGSC